MTSPEQLPSTPKKESGRFEVIPGNIVHSRNPETKKIELGWQVMGIDKDNNVLMQREHTGFHGEKGVEDRTQTLEEVVEVNESKILYNAVEDLLK